jgi:hypothetical protein
VKETEVSVFDTKGRPVRTSWSFDAKKAHKGADEAMKRGYSKVVKTTYWK